MFAQSISILTENINMQMEAEHSDLFDRKLISLYGMKEGQANKMDTAAPVSQAIAEMDRLESHKPKKKKRDANNSVSMSHDFSHQLGGLTTNMGSISKILTDNQSRGSSEDRHKNVAIDNYLDANISKDGSRS